MPQNAPHKRLLESCEEGDNMVSNLPLLFAAGYPTSLEKITESQLEKFIPFMVQCSLGDIRLQLVDQSSEPEWWPEDIPFVIPLEKPKNFTGNWFAKMKEIVAICYHFHKSVFLLRFCDNLSKYQTELLRFYNNHNSTTSLFDRSSNKLLVTFRNENMLYDQQPATKKKTLMPKTSSSTSIEPQQIVEQSLFEIYLCDNCDAELYSLDAFNEHEKGCRIGNVADEVEDDDDVIFCGEEESPPEDTAQQQLNFLQHFQLVSNNTSSSSQQQPQTSTSRLITPHKRNANGSGNNNLPAFNDKNQTVPAIIDQLAIPDKKPRRVPRKRHPATIFAKSFIPIVSEAGQKIINSNSQLTPDYQRERIERYERCCVAPPIAADGSNRPKFMDKTFQTYTRSSYRSNTKHFHYYRFPRRQFSSYNHDAAVAQLNRIRLRETCCKSLSVKLNRLTEEQIETLRIMPKLKRRKLSVKSTSSTSSSSMSMIRPSKIVDYIDLCSDTESVNECNASDSESNHGIAPNPNGLNGLNGPHSAHNAMLFVDCSDINGELNSNLSFGIDSLSDARLKPHTIIRKKYNSTSNKLQKYLSTHVQPTNIFASDGIQHDKENQLYPFITDQTSATAPNGHFLFETEIDSALDVSTTMPANNLIKIDLTI